jgi:putative addiction module CopG family antidote
MGVTLSPETEAKIQRWVDSGQYPDADAAVKSALQALEERNEARLENLRQLLRTGWESPSLGELTGELWDEIDRRADEKMHRDERPSPHVSQ